MTQDLPYVLLAGQCAVSDASLGLMAEYYAVISVTSAQLRSPAVASSDISWSNVYNITISDSSL